MRTPLLFVQCALGAERRVGLLSDDVWLLDEPKLRPAEQLSALCAVFYDLHCRLADF